jgi:PTS system nitrogen regulatory IIA component
LVDSPSHRSSADLALDHVGNVSLQCALDSSHPANRSCMVDLVLPRLRVSSKNALLEELARIAAPLARLDRVKLLAALQNRERMGCTGIGQGVALPHARFPAIGKPVTIFARLASPIEFEAVDGRRVDLVYLLLGPEMASDEHLKTLACAARLLREPTARQALRHAADETAIRAILSTERP